VQLQPTNKQTHAKNIIAFFSLSLSDQSKSHSFLFSTTPFLWSTREIKLRWRRKIAFCSASFLVREPENSIKMINIHQTRRVFSVGWLVLRRYNQPCVFRSPERHRFLWALGQIRVDLIKSNRA
jgi:hypothetical protein